MSKKPRSLTKAQKKKRLEDRQIRKTLWRRGYLRWKLHEIQKVIYDIYWEGNDDLTTMMISRQLGKSYVLAVIATELCLRKKNAIIKYVIPKKNTIKNILTKNMIIILQDCPADCRPEWKENDKVWKFPNGSEIQAAGTDNQSYDSIRGGTCDGWMVDEAGFCSDLEEVIYNVLIPTTTMTGGRGIISSTPNPKEPEHDFIRLFVNMAKEQGKLHKYTLYDNPRLTTAEVTRIENRYPGGKNNPKFRAEYMCEIVRDQDSMVVPEFDDEAEKAIVVSEVKRPKFYDTYISMDIGGKDFTAVLFGYYDFLRAKVVIEDELIFKEKQNTNTIAEGIKRKMEELWGEKQPYYMSADNNNIILLNDLQYSHNLTFIATKKDNKEAQINALRLRFLNYSIEIHERCKTLIYHLKTATWAKTSGSGYKKLSRSADGGHFDSVDALVYFLRNLVPSKNPYPRDYGAMGPENAYQRPPTKSYKDIFSMFKVKKDK